MNDEVKETAINAGDIKVGNVEQKQDAAKADDIVFSAEQQKKVDAIIAERIARANEQFDKKLEAKLQESEKLQKMSAEEKAQHDRAELQRQLEEAQQAVQRYQMSGEATTMLQAAGIKADSAILDIVVKTTAEETHAAIKAFSDAVTAAAEEMTRQKLSGTAPRIKSTAGTAITKDDIMKITDPEERVAAIAKNPELFRA